MTLTELADMTKKPENNTNGYANLSNALNGNGRSLPQHYYKKIVKILLNDRKNYPVVIYRHEFQRYLTLIPIGVYSEEEEQDILESLPVESVQQSESESSEVEERWKSYIADASPAALDSLLATLLQKVVFGGERTLSKELRLEVEDEWNILKDYERDIKIALVKLLIDDLKRH